MRAGKKGKREQVEDASVQPSSGNVFEDLGVPEAAGALAKAELAARIGKLIAERGLTQVEAARVLGIDQPSVSDLVRGQLRGFSSDRLFRFLNSLGRDVEIVIRPNRRPKALPRIRVVDQGVKRMAAGRRRPR